MAKAQRTGVIRDYDMHSASVRVGYGFIIFFCLIMTVVAVFPIIWVVLAGFKDLKEFMSSAKLLPEVFDFSLFAKTWSQLGIAQNYLNSLISVAGSVVCAIVFNGLLGYGLAILKPKGYGIVKKLVMLSLLLPTTISIVPLFMNIQKLNLGGSFVPLWLSYGANAMYVILFVQFFESLPTSIIEAGRIDGCTQLQTFFYIVLPLSKAALASIGLMFAVSYWNDYTNYKLYITTDQSLYNFQMKLRSIIMGSDLPAANGGAAENTVTNAAVIVAILPFMILYPFLQKYFVKGINIGAVKE